MPVPAVDFEMLRSRTLDDGALMADLLALFRNETASGLAKLRRAGDAGDAAAARSAAHRLKGSALTIAAAALAGLASDAERHWHANDAASGRALLAAIETEAARCLAEIDARCPPTA